jgi:ferredoxin
MEEDKAVVFVPAVPKGAEDACKKAVEECPVTCITIE